MENYINQLITKVLNREASTEEIIRFSQWLSEEENNKDEFRKLKSYWDAEISFGHTINPEHSMQKTLQKIHVARSRKVRRVTLYGISIAASIAILLGIGFYFMNGINGKKNIPVEYYTYLAGQNKTNFTLMDGTKIYLNKNSKLVHTNRYNETDRLVKLEGEAYFEVWHNPEKPFVVEVGDAQIKALGTSFNVKKDEQANIRTTLSEGSIRFDAPGQQVVLVPNQQLIYTNSSHRVEVAMVNIDKELAWMEGVIRHKSVLFSDLIEGLMKQFQVRIIINNDKLKNSQVVMTGTFSEDQSLEEILKVISITYPFTWDKRDEIYYIK